MVVGYTRVSTGGQTVDSQKFSIKKYCDYREFKIDEFVEETVSGTVPREKRKLGKLVNELKEGDILVTSELSRLGRTITDTLVTLEMLQNKKVQIHLIKENLVSGTCEFTMLCGVYSIIASTERQRISERTKEALRMRMAQGIHIGRRKGQKPSKTKLTPYSNEIIKMISVEKRSISYIAHKYEVTWSTAKHYIVDVLKLDIRDLPTIKNFKHK